MKRYIFPSNLPYFYLIFNFFCHFFLPLYFVVFILLSFCNFDNLTQLTYPYTEFTRNAVHITTMFQSCPPVLTIVITHNVIVSRFTAIQITHCSAYRCIISTCAITDRTTAILSIRTCCADKSVNNSAYMKAPTTNDPSTINQPFLLSLFTNTSSPRSASSLLFLCFIHIQIPTNCNGRSEEHISELQSRAHLVCRLPPETKKHI